MLLPLLNLWLNDSSAVFIFFEKQPSPPAKRSAGDGQIARRLGSTLHHPLASVRGRKCEGDYQLKVRHLNEQLESHCLTLRLDATRWSSEICTFETLLYA